MQILLAFFICYFQLYNDDFDLNTYKDMFNYSQTSFSIHSILKAGALLINFKLLLTIKDSFVKTYYTQPLQF